MNSNTIRRPSKTRLDLPPMLDGKPMRVLVAENDELTRSKLCDILELDGYCVSNVRTAEATLAHAILGDFTAIVLDRNLPDGTVEELLPKLNEVAPNAVRIIVTGHADLEGTIAALRHGASDYLLKPINPDSLRASLSRIYRLREAEQRAAQAERLATMGQMIASIGHESRNALQRIDAQVDLMKLIAEGDPEIAESLHAIESASASLQRMFEELREFSATIELDYQTFRPEEIAETAWASLRCLPGFEGVNVEIQMPDCAMTADPFRIEQVFRNLLENAVAACPNPVEIAIEGAMISVGGHEVIEIAFRDNGPGFTPHQRENAFEPFFTTKKKGTGLGLAICKRIVELHGGQIEIDASSKHGACIFFRIPCCKHDDLRCATSFESSSKYRIA